MLSLIGWLLCCHCLADYYAVTGWLIVMLSLIGRVWYHFVEDHSSADVQCFGPVSDVCANLLQTDLHDRGENMWQRLCYGERWFIQSVWLSALHGQLYPCSGPQGQSVSPSYSSNFGEVCSNTWRHLFVWTDALWVFWLQTANHKTYV